MWCQDTQRTKRKSRYCSSYINYLPLAPQTSCCCQIVACSRVFTCHKFLVIFRSSRPASVCGCSVSLTRIFCQTWKIHRCTRVCGQHRAMASNIPFWPSQTTTVGHGNCCKSLAQVWLDSQPTHSHPITKSGVRATRQTMLPTSIPSKRMTGYIVIPSGNVSSVCDCLPMSQATNRSSTNARLRSGRGLTCMLVQF